MCLVQICSDKSKTFRVVATLLENDERPLCFQKSNVEISGTIFMFSLLALSFVNYILMHSATLSNLNIVATPEALCVIIWVKKNHQ